MRFFLRMYDFGVKKQFEGIHRSTFDLTNQRYFWCIFTMHRRHLWEKKNNFIILWYKNRHRRLNNSSKTFFKSMEIYSFFETENVVWIFSQFNIMLPISFQVVFKFFAVNIVLQDTVIAFGKRDVKKGRTLTADHMILFNQSELNQKVKSCTRALKPSFVKLFWKKGTP